MTAIQGIPVREPAPGGIPSLVLGVLGLSFLPLVGSVLALVFGAASRRATTRDPVRYSDTLGAAGRVLGWIGVALLVPLLLVAALTVVAVAPVSSSMTSSDPVPVSSGHAVP